MLDDEINLIIEEVKVLSEVNCMGMNMIIGI